MATPVATGYVLSTVVFVNFVVSRWLHTCPVAKELVNLSDCAGFPHSLNFFLSDSMNIDDVIVINVIIVVMLLKYK